MPSGLPVVVEHREHAVRAVDAGGGDQHHVAALEQEVGEAAALRGIEIGQARHQVLAHRQDALPPMADSSSVLRRQTAGAGLRT